MWPCVWKLSLLELENKLFFEGRSKRFISVAATSSCIKIQEPRLLPGEAVTLWLALPTAVCGHASRLHFTLSGGII